MNTDHTVNEVIQIARAYLSSVEEACSKADEEIDNLIQTLGESEQQKISSVQDKMRALRLINASECMLGRTKMFALEPDDAYALCKIQKDMIAMETTMRNRIIEQLDNESQEDEG